MENDTRFEKIKPFLKSWKKDYIFKTMVSTVLSFSVTILFALYNGFLGVRLLSIWHGGICVFYLLLAAIRGIILLTEKNNRTRDEKQKSECRQKTFMISVVMLLLLNLSLIFPISLICPVCDNKTCGRIREDTVLKNYPLHCPKCKQKTSVHKIFKA